MKKVLLILATSLFHTLTYAQGYISGICGKDVVWSFDGKTLSINNVSKNKSDADMNNSDIKNKPDAVMDNYDTKKYRAPWLEKGLDVRNVRIGAGITAIGSCAFANLPNLNEVVFESNDIQTIEWGAFYNCVRLSNISLPNTIRRIGTIAFANCRTMNAIKIPDQCHVQDQAFLNCSSVRSIEVSPTASLGEYVFAGEITIDGKVRHTLYNYEVGRLPNYINSGNCHSYGFAKDVIERLRNGKTQDMVDYDYITSEVDSVIPRNSMVQEDLYALIIGNENYRFVPGVPFAIHDARVFSEYCEKTLGIPSQNIHVCEDATKQLIIDDEFGWLESIEDKGSKRLIVYYAGHGVPDTKKQNKAYLLPTDVRGTKPQNGISLDDFYGKLGEMAFQQTSVFLDACFSGINRNNESVNEGLRGVEIVAEEGTISEGNMVVFSAAQGNETAQGFQEQGHGLFTYYLLKSLQETDGNIYFGDLSDNLKSKVSQRAKQLKLRKPQTPSTNASNTLEDTWRNLTF